MNSIIKLFKSTDSSSDLPLRVGLGVVFIAHGSQKLFGWFGGYGLEATGQWMESIGLAPGILMAAAAGSVEFFGGILLLAGLFTRVAALAAAVTMGVAIASVHWQHGFFMANNGYEFALTLLLVAAALVVSGGGRFSLDRRLFGQA